MRCAIYARMSTDKQSDTSPEDQIARCREYAGKKGWQIVESAIVAEAGISGASRHNRPGLLGLMARIDEWDCLLCFDSSRLARNGEDLGWIRNRLRVRKRTGIEVSSGLDLENIGSQVMGVMNEQYLKKVGDDTRRGLRGCFDRKLATGGAPFGYRTVPIVVGQDAHGHPVTQGCRLEVDPEVAPVVVRLFEGYARQRLGIKALAHQLNAEGMAPPRPRGHRGLARHTWSPSAIREMLRNPIYKGERVWNKSEWLKCHETGRRQRYDRPEPEWVRQQDEVWRIVSDELWQDAQQVRARRNQHQLRDPKGRIVRSASRSAPRKRLLSGFLECGECGGSFHQVSASGLWGCSWRKNRGPSACANDAKIPQAILEGAILHAMREALDEEVAAHALEVALDELRRRLATSEPKRLEETLGQLDTKVARALDLAIELGDLAEAKTRLAALRAERDRVARELEQSRTPLPSAEDFRPQLRAMLKHVESMLRADVALGRLALGGLLGENRVRISRDGRIEGLADLAPLLAAPEVAHEVARQGRSGGLLHACCVDLPVRIAA